LEPSSTKKNGDEVVVVEEFFEHIEVLSANLSAVDLVEKLKEHERVEYLRKVLQLSCGPIDLLLSVLACVSVLGPGGINVASILRVSGHINEHENHHNHVPE
tara:strand:+ start:460 stop:765 length:306 start_codon:yes stop_codon:yes gene_type:complete